MGERPGGAWSDKGRGPVHTFREEKSGVGTAGSGGGTSAPQGRGDLRDEGNC